MIRIDYKHSLSLSSFATKKNNQINLWEEKQKAISLFVIDYLK